MGNFTYKPHTLLLPPSQLHSSAASPEQPRTRVLLILNAPLTDAALLERVWHTCPVRICADGGANRLLEFLRGVGGQKEESLVSGVARSCVSCFVMQVCLLSVYDGSYLGDGLVFGGKLTVLVRTWKRLVSRQ